MRTCKCCRKEFEEDKCQGRDVKGKGVLMMGYGSKYDWNIYQFTLVAGWYCYDCLDKEIAQGLCQPLYEWGRPNRYKFDLTPNPMEFLMPKGSDEWIDQEKANENWARLLKRLGLTEEDFK